MMKINDKVNLFVLFFCSMMFTACFNDDSTEAIKTVSDITVNDINTKYTKNAFVGDRLQITPEVITDYPESDMEYEWLLYDAKTGTVEANGDTISPVVIGTAKQLDYEINLAPGSYQGRFEAKSKSNGYTVYKKFELSVQTMFSEGYYILKETQDGNTELDLAAGNGTIEPDLIEKTHGTSMKGKPQSLWMNYGQYYVNPDEDKINAQNSVTVISQSGNFLTLRATDLATMFDRNNLLFDKMDDSEQPYAFLLQATSGTIYLSDKGIRTANNVNCLFNNSETSGKFGYPDPETGASPFVTISQPSYGAMLFWDNKSSSMCITNYNQMLQPVTYSDMTGAELTQNLKGWEPLAIGDNYINGEETWIMLMLDPSGQRYLYILHPTLSQLFLDKRIKIDPNSHVAHATLFSVNGISARYLYCVDGGKLYGCNFSEDDLPEVEMPLQGIGTGESITYITNQYWSNGMDNDFDYFIVGTQKGYDYKLYFYKMNGGAPIGNPVKVVEGKGIVKSVRYLSPSINSSYWFLDEQIYPVND